VHSGGAEVYVDRFGGGTCVLEKQDYPQISYEMEICGEGRNLEKGGEAVDGMECTLECFCVEGWWGEGEQKDILGKAGLIVLYGRGGGCVQEKRGGEEEHEEKGRPDCLSMLRKLIWIDYGGCSGLADQAARDVGHTKL